MAKQKTRPNRNYERAGKTISKKTDKKNLKKNEIKVKIAHVNKTTSEKVRFGLNKKTKPRMNYEWIGKTIKKKIWSKKTKKTVKIKVKLPHVDKKITSEKANF